MNKMSPPTLMLFCVLGMIALHWFLPLLPFSNWVPLLLGVGFIGFGLVMAFGAEGQFRRNGTTVDHLGMPSKLVNDGWFKYSRNPMYLSFALVLAGAWLSLGSISPILGILIYFVLTEQWYIRPEEKRIAEKFGNTYAAYKRQTRRWL